MTPELYFILLGFNILLSLVAFFGGMVIRGLRADVVALRLTDEKLAEKLNDFTHKDDFKDFREEQRRYQDENRAMLTKLFDRLDSMNEKLANKQDRPGQS